MTLIVPLPLLTVAPSEHVYLIKKKSVCFFPFLLCVTFVALLFFQLRTQAAQEDEPRVKERLLMPETY